MIPHAAVYLAGYEAAFVHGSVIDVDGGRTTVAVGPRWPSDHGGRHRLLNSLHRARTELEEPRSDVDVRPLPGLRSSSGSATHRSAERRRFAFSGRALR